MTNKLNRSDYLILDTLHGSNMTDQFHSMTIEEIMEETGNVLTNGGHCERIRHNILCGEETCRQ